MVLHVQCPGKNVGWRIDYFLVSERLGTDQEATIYAHVMGSDPVPLDWKFNQLTGQLTTIPSRQPLSSRL